MGFNSKRIRKYSSIKNHNTGVNLNLVTRLYISIGNDEAGKEEAIKRYKKFMENPSENDIFFNY